MFDSVGDPAAVAQIRALAGALSSLRRDVGNADRVDRIRALEELKAACAAAQARDAADLDASQRAAQVAAGVPEERLGLGVGAQVALARRESPHRGGRYLGLAKALVHEMPATLSALASGRLSEWRATLLVQGTACLSREDRAAVDAEVAGDLDALERLGDRALTAAVARAAYRRDPRAVVERARRAERERRVTLRPAPDTMAWLTALLPVRDAVAVHATLSRAADAARAGGDARGRGQVMADTLVGAVTGAAAPAEAVNSPPAPPLGRAARDVALRLVMTDRALLDGDAEPAVVEGYGPVPAGWARAAVAEALDAGTRVFLTRVLTDPAGRLVAAESRSRLAPPGLAAVIRLRDGGTCRTPWCDAPARQVDHVVPHARGGGTTAQNLQALCEACNQVKQAPGWRASPAERAGPFGGGVVVTTPTGHRHRSTPPPLPACRAPAVAGSAVERRLAAALRAS